MKEERPKTAFIDRFSDSEAAYVDLF